MKKAYLFNGELQQTSLQLDPSNRAFKYGDGVFETIKVSQGYPLFYRSHYSRLIRGIDALQMDIPGDFHFIYFLNCLKELIQYSEVYNGMIRVQAWRGGKGAYASQASSFEWIAQIKSSDKNEPFFNWEPREYRLDIYEDMRKNYSKVSSYKTCNALPYVLAAEFRKGTDFDNVALLNDEGHVVETIAENIFIYRNGVVQTPPVTDGPVEGIMRSMLRKIFLWNKIEFEEKSLTVRDIEKAQEVFLSNSLKGIIPVTHFRDKTYFHAFSEGLIHKLNERIAQILEKNTN